MSNVAILTRQKKKYLKAFNVKLIFLSSSKGVDVGIAVDMMSKMAEYDAAILVSGDADFMPVVRYLKDHLRYVYQFSLALGIPPKIKNLSPWLRR